MYGSRSIYLRKKPILILNNSKFSGELEVGSKGQATLKGEIVGERLEFNDSDQTNYIVKIVKVINLTPVKNEVLRDTK